MNLREEIEFRSLRKRINIGKSLLDILMISENLKRYDL